MFLFLDVVSPIPEFHLIKDKKIIVSIKITENNDEKLSDTIIPKYLKMSKTYELLEIEKDDMTSLESYIKEYYQQILKRLREMEADLNIEEKKRLPF